VREIHGLTPLHLETQTQISRIAEINDEAFGPSRVIKDATPLNHEDVLSVNRAGWDHVAPRFHGGTALPNYGPLAPTEDTLHLLGAIQGIRALEIGCGSGHSLAYLARRGAAEVWGLDLSATQIGFATETLKPFLPNVRLFHSPMEVDPGLPAGYFDLVFSIYGLGWTVDLPTTLALAARYLKPGGLFLVTGEHPAYSCLRYEDGRYIMAEPYAAEGPSYIESWSGAPIVIHRRTLGTFVTAVALAGLCVEQLIECDVDDSAATDAQRDPARWYSVARARMVPTTVILTARKPAHT